MRTDRELARAAAPQEWIDGRGAGGGGTLGWARSGLSTARLLQGVLGCAFLVFAVWLLAGFPVARLPLIGVAMGLAVLQWRFDRAWLLFVPTVLAVVDFGAWSGRLLAGEQDALLAVLVATALLSGQYRDSGVQLWRRSFLPVWLLLAVVLIGAVRGLFPLSPLDANAWGGYLTGWNALRVAKGPLWALVFWPLLAKQLTEGRDATELQIARGMVAALLGFGVCVLWERGLFLDLMTAHDVWGLFSTWMDLAGTYRITGPLSQMHLGGEAVDGVLLLAWPFALFFLLRARGWASAAAALLALGLAAYALMVTFTRTTYLAAALALLAFVAFGISGQLHRAGGAIVITGLYIAAAAALSLWGFPYGGSLLLLANLVLVVGGLAVGQFGDRVLSRLGVAAAISLLLALGVVLALHGILTSKWSEVEPSQAIVIALPSALVLGLGGFAIGRVLRPLFEWRVGVVLSMGLGILLAVLTLGVSGTQMKVRAASMASDLDTRLNHWRHGLALLPDDVATRVAGAGLGTFPLASLLSNAAGEGTWYFGHDDREHYLHLLGTGSLNFGQRIAGLPRGVYTITARVRNRSGQPASLQVKLQPRRMLELDEWQPRTQDHGFPVAPDDRDWRPITWTLRVTSAASPPWFDPATTVFALANYGTPASSVDVTDVRMTDLGGREFLKNGDFQAGSDRWLAYNDFHHLAWHLKNLYVAIWFDLGLLGVIAFATVALTVLVRSFAEARRGRMFGAAVGAALVGFLTLGLTGTLLDVPQIMTLFVMIMIAGLWRARNRKRLLQRQPAPPAFTARNARHSN